MPRGEEALKMRPAREDVAEKWEKIRDLVPTLTDKALAEKKKMAQG